MSRNKLYKHRIELCLNTMQFKIVKELAKKAGKTMNEIVREAIMEAWEKV